VCGAFTKQGAIMVFEENFFFFDLFYFPSSMVRMPSMGSKLSPQMMVLLAWSVPLKS